MNERISAQQALDVCGNKDIPDADELNLDFSAKRLFEASCDGDAGGIRPLVELVSERNLLRIVPRKEPYLQKFVKHLCHITQTV